MRRMIHRFLARQGQAIGLAVALLVCVEAHAAAQNTSTTLAWQRTDRYCAPDAAVYFPDDPEGGRKLEALFRAVDKDRQPDAEILATVRQGLRACRTACPSCAGSATNISGARSRKIRKRSN